MEIWRDYHENSEYQVSNTGEVRSLKGSHPRILRKSPSGKYRKPAVFIYNEKEKKSNTIRYVARMVLFTFDENYNGEIVEYLDNDCNNVHIDNLTFTPGNFSRGHYRTREGMV